MSTSISKETEERLATGEWSAVCSYLAAVGRCEFAVSVESVGKLWFGDSFAVIYRSQPPFPGGRRKYGFRQWDFRGAGQSRWCGSLRDATVQATAAAFQGYAEIESRKFVFEA